MFGDTHANRSPAPADKIRSAYVPRSTIRPMANDKRDRTTAQYREHRDALAADMKKHGMKTPLWVQELPEGAYGLLAGGTRLDAAALADIDYVPVRIVPGSLTEGQQLMEQWIENELHEGFNRMELLDFVCGMMAANNWTAAELCRNVSKLKESRVAKLLAMKDLSPEVQDLVRSGRLRARAAYAISRISDTAVQLELAMMVVEGRLSVQGVESRVKRLLGKRERTKTTKIKFGNVVTTVKGNVLDELDAFVAKAAEVIKKIKRGDYGPHGIEMIVSLLKS